jgi:hypothetical protein
MSPICREMAKRSSPPPASSAKKRDAAVTVAADGTDAAAGDTSRRSCPYCMMKGEVPMPW